MENIEVTDQEIDQRFNEMYAGQRMNRRERRSRRESLDDMLKYEKTVALLVDIAKSDDQSAEARTEPSAQDAQEGDAQDDE